MTSSNEISLRFLTPKLKSCLRPWPIGVRVGWAAAPTVLKNLRANSVFQGKRKLLKNPECKKFIQYSENFQGDSVFQGKRELLKNPER